MTEALALGMVVWIVTTILVEGKIFEPLRDAADRWAGPTVETPPPHPCRVKLTYLIHCHLCAGTWIGLATAAVTPYRPLNAELPLVAWVLAGLLYKAIAHTVLAVNNTLRRFS